jgi:hypothetical protein
MTCIQCHRDTGTHPIYCVRHRFAWLPCGNDIDSPYCDGPVYYNYLEHAKAKRLAREAGLPKGGIIPFKLCTPCRISRYARIGLANT